MRMTITLLTQSMSNEEKEKTFKLLKELGWMFVMNCKIGESSDYKPSKLRSIFEWNLDSEPIIPDSLKPFIVSP